MKLLFETIESVEFLTEAGKDGGSKSYFINGPFMQSEIENRNGRIYPKKILEKQVESFQAKIQNKQAVGELSHPSTPTINYDRVSHLITELHMQNNDAVGKAKILPTMPMGKIVTSLIDEGIKLGVSSRGLGSLSEKGNAKMVNEFFLTTVDIVHEPSAPNAYVENVVENVEWFFDGVDWRRQEKAINLTEDFKKKKKAERETQFINLWKNLLEV
jgi:hypothetical protein